MTKTELERSRVTLEAKQAEPTGAFPYCNEIVIEKIAGGLDRLLLASEREAAIHDLTRHSNISRQTHRGLVGVTDGSSDLVDKRRRVGGTDKDPKWLNIVALTGAPSVGGRRLSRVLCALRCLAIVLISGILPGLSFNAAKAAIGADRQLSSGCSGCSLDYSHTVGLNSNRALLVGVQYQPPNNCPTCTVLSVTYGGTPLLPVGRYTTAATLPTVGISLYYLLNPSSGENTIHVNFDPRDGGAGLAAIASASYYGVSSVNLAGLGSLYTANLHTNPLQTRSSNSWLGGFASLFNQTVVPDGGDAIRTAPGTAGIIDMGHPVGHTVPAELYLHGDSPVNFSYIAFELVPVAVAPNAATSIGADWNLSSGCSGCQLDYTHTVGTNPNRILLVGVFYQAPPCPTCDGGVLSITYGGAALLPLGPYKTSLQYPTNGMGLYYLLNPSPGVNTVHVNFNPADHGQGYASVASASYYGVSGVNSVSTGALYTAAPDTIPLTTTNNGSWLGAFESVMSYPMIAGGGDLLRTPPGASGMNDTGAPVASSAPTELCLQNWSGVTSDFLYSAFELIPLAVAQSVSLANPSASDSVLLANPAFANSGNVSERWEMRLSNPAGFPTGSFTTYVATLGPLNLIFNYGRLEANYAVNPPAADTVGPASIDINCCTGITDMMIRLQRDVPDRMYTLQMCVTQTEVCQTQTFPITALGTTTDWTNWSIAFLPGSDVAWIRWFSTVVPAGSAILNSATGDVLDWEFKGNLTDSVLGLSFSGGTVSFSPTPALPPACLPIPQQTFALGNTGTVTASCQPLDNGSTLLYNWSYLGTGADGIAQSLTFGSPAASTTVSGFVKGSVNLNLKVTDGSGNSTNVTVHDGAVNTNAQDVVITGLPVAQDAILGPILRWGSPRNRVPWFDDRNKALLDLQGPALSTNFPDYWDSAAGSPVGTFAPGTVAVARNGTCGGSPVGTGIVGTGTSFTQLPGLNYTRSASSVIIPGTGTYTFVVASGLAYVPGLFVSATSTINSNNAIWGTVSSYSGTSLTITGASLTQAVAGTYTDWNIISPQYNVIAWNGGMNRALTEIMSVSSDTCMILAYAWYDNDETGLSFTGPVGTGWWGMSQTSTPGNYYDNVKAYRSLYERSGIDSYWTYYTTLADSFWRNPAMDQGVAFRGGYEYQFTNRSQSLEGMIIRATDSGKSGMWTGIDQAIASNELYLTLSIPNYGIGYGDTRVGAYAVEFVALGAQYSPTPANASSYLGALSNVMPYYQKAVQANGNVPNIELTLSNTSNLVNVTQGSTTVTCSSCNFSGLFTGPGLNNSSFLTFTTATVPANNTAFSSVYYPTVSSATQIILDRPYQEASGTSGWAYSPSPYVPGWGAQPFMVGMETTALLLAADAISASSPSSAVTAVNVANGDAGWLSARGYADPAHGGVGGMYYFQDYLTCSFPVQTPSCTDNGTASQTRTDAGEAIRGLTQAYLKSPTPAKATFLATLIDQMFCKPGFAGAGTTCNTDGSYVSDLDNGGTFMTPLAISNKWVGFFFGWDSLINTIAILSQ
jgi:hypothetical protein